MPILLAGRSTGLPAAVAAAFAAVTTTLLSSLPVGAAVAAPPPVPPTTPVLLQAVSPTKPITAMVAAATPRWIAVRTEHSLSRCIASGLVDVW